MSILSHYGQRLAMPPKTAKQALTELRRLGNPHKAVFAQRFFKTGKGQYGEGDVFLGLTVPDLRKLIPVYRDLSLAETVKLLRSKEHEARLLAAFLLVSQYKHGTDKERKAIYATYLANTRFINNWDIIDSSAAYIVGDYLETRSKTILKTLAHSPSIWERRIAIVSTFHFIKKGEGEQTFLIAKILLRDPQDLIQKATGWMLREVGKRSSIEKLRGFLHEHAAKMPRTMLRYAIERMDPYERAHWMKQARLKA
jgi:3-methyladenine DNA glycosylase AlkD